MEEGGRDPVQMSALLTQTTGWLLYTAGRGVVRELEEELRHDAVGWRDYEVLGVLEASGALSQQAIGRRLAIDRSTMVHIIDGLERRGLVARGRDLTDRRAYAIELTDAGRALLAEVLHPATAAVCQRLIGTLTSEDRAHLDRILTKLRDRP